MGTPIDTIPYTYSDATWGDLLTAYDCSSRTYDDVGNLWTDGTWAYTWQNGRELVFMTDGPTAWSYTYDANGMRTDRTFGTTIYRYVYNGSQLSQMTVDGNTLNFAYDAGGVPMTVNYNGTNYYYIVNLQGDVTGITNSSGTLVVSYTYDAWGKPLSITGSMAATLGTLNPLRYRGYVYDTETGLYYLESRYYDPEIGRFINADTFVATGQGMLGNNMFAYCLNNPVNYVDVDGNTAEALQWWTAGMAWLPFADAILPIGDIIYVAGIMVLGLYAITVVDESSATTVIVEEKEPPVMEYSEHKKGARQSTKGKHEKGQTRKGRDNRGEKGDVRRVYLGNKKKTMMLLFLADDLFGEDYGNTTPSLSAGSGNVSRLSGVARSSFWVTCQVT